MSSHHRQIFKSSIIVGGSSAIGMALSVLKVKVLALLLGPAGVGLMGIYQNIMNLVATFVNCGMRMSSIRHIAADENPTHRILVRRALWWFNLTFGAIGMLVMWIVRKPLAQWIFGHTHYATDIGFVGIGVFFILISSSQTAILQGYLRIADLARINIISALGGTLFGILIPYFFGHAGIIYFVIVAPFWGTLAGIYYFRRLPMAKEVKTSRAELFTQIRNLMRLGIPFMVSNLGTVGTQFLARWIVLRTIDIKAAGHFQASWQISTVYIGLILQSISMDYYPRVSAAFTKSYPKAHELIHHQMEMALWMSAPLLVGMIGFSPWLIWALYSHQFTPAIPLLAWQSLGNLFKIFCWPMTYSFLASNRGVWFFLIEMSWNLIFLAILYWGLDIWGLTAAGIAFFLAYVCYWLLLLIITSKIIAYRPSWYVLKLLGIYLFAAGSSLILFVTFPILGMICSALFTLAFGIHSLRNIDRAVGLRVWIAKKLGKKTTGSIPSQKS